MIASCLQQLCDLSLCRKKIEPCLKWAEKIVLTMKLSPILKKCSVFCIVAIEWSSHFLALIHDRFQMQISDWSVFFLNLLEILLILNYLDNILDFWWKLRELLNEYQLSDIYIWTLYDKKIHWVCESVEANEILLKTDWINQINYIPLANIHHFVTMQIHGNLYSIKYFLFAMKHTSLFAWKHMYTFSFFKFISSKNTELNSMNSNYNCSTLESYELTYLWIHRTSIHSKHHFQ